MKFDFFDFAEGEAIIKSESISKVQHFRPTPTFAPPRNLAIGCNVQAFQLYGTPWA